MNDEPQKEIEKEIQEPEPNELEAKLAEAEKLLEKEVKQFTG